MLQQRSRLRVALVESLEYDMTLLSRADLVFVDEVDRYADLEVRRLLEATGGVPLLAATNRYAAVRHLLRSGVEVRQDMAERARQLSAFCAASLVRAPSVGTLQRLARLTTAYSAADADQMCRNAGADFATGFLRQLRAH